MRSWLASVVILLCPYPTLASAQPNREPDSYVVYWDANQLYKYCTTPRLEGACFGYIEGIADVLGRNEKVAGNRACVPPAVNGNRLREIVLSEIESMPPSNRTLGASMVVTLALAAKYPC